MKMPAFFIWTNVLEVVRSNGRGLFQTTKTSLKFSGLYGTLTWKVNAEGHKQSRRFLECIDDNFLTQLVKDLTKGSTLLGLILKNEEKPARNMKVRPTLAALTVRCQTSWSWETKQITAGSQSLGCRRVDLVDESPWKNAVGYSPREEFGLFWLLFSP